MGGCYPVIPLSYKKAQRFEITKDDVTVHESWDLSKFVNNGNDIALIRLPRPALTFEEDFNQIVQPVCLGWDNTIQVPDANYIVSGFAHTNNNVYNWARSQLVRESRQFGSQIEHINLFQNIAAVNNQNLRAEPEGRLKKNEAFVIPLDQCKKDYSIFKDLSEKQICADGFVGTVFFISIH